MSERNAIERLREATTYWRAQISQNYPGLDADLAAVDALYQAAKAAVDIHRTPNARWDFHPFQDDFVQSLNALAAAVSRVEKP